jgi:hypothetical protein
MCLLARSTACYWQGRITPETARAATNYCVQRGDVWVLDEPSMVGLMVWVELSPWRPWFGWSIMMMKASAVKIRVGESGFQLEGILSKQVGTTRAVMCLSSPVNSLAGRNPV